MRILHTVQGYFPYIGGSEELIRRLSETLVARGHDVTVFTSFHPKRDFTELNGVKVRQFRVHGSSAVGIIGDGDAYVDSVVQSDVDVMLNYAAQTWATDLLLPHLKRIRAKKILAPCGYSGLKKPKFSNYYATLPQFLRQYDLLVYHSSFYQDKTFGDQHGLTRHDIVYNFADEAEFNASPTDFSAKYSLGSRRICLTVANHFREKGHAFVIDAFLKSNLDDTILLIIGNPFNKWNVKSDCYFECKLREVISRGRVKLLTDLPRPDVVAAFMAADVFLFGSAVECSPLVIFEAMASHTPWISTDVGNVRELPGGWVVKSIDEMSRKLKLVFASHVELKDKGEQGYGEFRSRFSLEKISLQYEQLYQRLLK